MAQRILYIWVFVLLIISLKTDKTRSDYVKQPTIHLNKGDLILESAYDRNITLRLTHDSALYVNNVNVLEKLRQRYAPSAILDGETKPSQQFSVHEVKSEIQNLQEDLERLATRLITAQNRTRRTLQLGVIRRNLGRINRLNGRLLVLERKLKKDECQESTEPCKNGGTCYDSYNGFHCECSPGYTGKTCEVDVDECYMLAGTDLGCQNNAACINTPGSYKCICAKGFSGTHCRLRNAICHQHLSGELCGHGSCVPANNAQGYTCICDQGWQRNITTSVNGTNLPSLACDIDVNECEESRNPCFNECINLPGGFKCGPCPPGYTGNGVTCLDVDECAVNNGGCSVLPKVRCINTEGSYRCGNCPPGWLGDGHICELAPSNSCNDQKICHPQAKCEYISEIPSCTCPPGMFGHGFGPQGCHTNPITDSCENHLCLNNGTCLAQGRTTSCLCPAGFSGALCEIKSGCQPNPCENGGTCKPSGSDSFKCVCGMGTTGKRCEIERSVCSRTLRRPVGELKYPTDDSPEYAFNEKCAWIIRTNATEILNVTFTKFDLEESTDCNNDFLQIHDGNSLASQLIGRFCGQTLPLGGTILSSHNVLFFWFKSNNATNRPGFEMSWSSQPYICGGDLILSGNEVGVIKSPGYPGKTPANRECQWQLTAPYGNRFVLRIYDVSLGSLPNCTGDVLKIYDADLMLKQYCESSLAEVLHSSSNQVLLHFHTDRFASDSAFQLHYAVEPGLPHCGGLYTEAKGFIMGPSQQATCLYLIQQPSGTQVKWEFLDFQTYANINCELNRIEIFDGKTDEDERLLVSCGGRKPEPVISSSNYMLVRFTSSLRVDSSQITPFKAKYSRACEFRVFGPDGGVLTTPNYPKPYVEHITCTFYIYGPGNTFVAANFTDVSLAETNPNEIADTADSMGNINNRTTSSNLNDDSITYMDVYLSKTNKRRYYKAAPMHLLAQGNEMIVVFHATTNGVKARGIRLEYSFETMGCGGIFSGNNGTIFEPLTERFCALTFTNDEGKHLKVNFDFIGFSKRVPILIYANTTNNGDVLLRNTTSAAYKVKDTFNFNTVTMIILSPTLLTGTYEFISTAYACGGNYSTLYGAVTSPSWPRAYQANLDCVWIITASLGNKIELQVHNFTLEPTCSGDILEIRNGKYPDSPLIGRYCENRIPSRIASFTNSLYLRFTSDSYVQGPGFYLNWQQTSTGCGGKLTSYSGSIHTPHYDDEPEVRGMNNLKLTCDWLIVVSQGSVIDLSITTAEDELEFCYKNNLRIYDGASTLNSILYFDCSAILKGQHLHLKSTTNQLLIIYTLTEDSKYTSPEFLIDYETNCNTVIYDNRGVIESPNFPEDYPKNLNCNWHLKTGRNNKFQLMFSHLNVEVEDMDCEYDYVEIVDMKDLDVLKKRRLCFKPQEPIISEGNQLIVHFVTDYSNTKEGFHMEFTSVGCGEHLSKEFGSITSPNYPYSSDMDCDWSIEVAAGRQISLTVIEFHLENENPDCGQNVLQLKESRNSSYELAKECQQQQVPLTVTSPANRLFIHFRTSAVRSRKFFKAFYHTKRATCGGIFRATSGFITLANQPSVMGGNVDCTWEIYMPESYGIVLDFQQFELRNSPNCSDNSMEFFISNYSAPKSLGKFCGSEKPNLKTIHNNRILIEYRERGHHEMANFTIRYRKQCGGLVSRADGYLKALTTEDCRWEFDFPADTLISLHIIQLDCYCPKNQTTALNCGHYLGIRRNYFDADIEANDNQTLYLCERHQTDMMIEATRLDIFTRNINFQAKFSTIQNTCGGYIESAQGTIVSPHFPSTYPPNMDCTWTIQGSKGSFLQLQFVSLDIAKSEHCNEDYLEIRTWSESKLLGLYCGSELPSSELTSYERLWLRFHSSPGNIGKGFEITWSYAHLNELVNVSRGYIANPPVNMVQDNEEPYAWRIMVERGAYIELIFREYNQGLKLYDGYDDTAFLVGIQASPWRFVSTTNVVFLQTDNENFETFSIVWNVTTIKPLSDNATLSKCHSEEFVKVHRFNGLRVMSPGYPKGYEQNMNCDWIFKPFFNVEHVAVKLYDVDLETIGSCSADYLRISTSVDLVTWHKQQQLCNGSNVQKWAMESPFMFVDGTPHLKLEFKTDGSVNRTGFLAKVVAKCGSNLTDSVGFIDGKMLWDFYDGPNTECVWHVNLKPGKRIQIKLDYPNMPLVKEDIDESCALHALLYDGIDDHAPLIKPGKLCYPQNVTVIQSNTTSNHLTIKYRLNFDKVASKLARISYWNLTYREFSECSQDIRLIDEAPEVNITSPQYPNVPHPHTECEWRVVAPQGELLQIEFLERFDMNARYCAKEHIELFDGSTALARSLGRYCTKPPALRTTQNMLYIQYLTDIAEPRNGFKARISISKCGGIFDATYGVITSPGYPGSYPANCQCDFVISLPRSKFLHLSFIDMNLPFDERKLNASDHLEIITIGGPANDTPAMIFYGNTTNTTSLQIASNKAILRFHTYQKTFKHRGFSVRYNSLGTYCSHSTMGVSGIINMNLPTKTHFQNVCSWKITVPKMQKARLEFLNMEDFQIENITDNLRFTLYNSLDMTSEIVSFNPATFDRNSVIESTDNLIHIRVVVPRAELRLRPLKIRYSSDNESPCPHDIETDDISGSIDIPGGRAEFMGNFYCGMKIKLNEGETIAFNISILTVSGYKLGLAAFAFRDSYVNIYYRSNLTGFIHTQSKTLGSVTIVQNKDDRIHRLKMSYKKYPCGGTVAVNNGQQIKPPTPDTVNRFNGREIVCRWNLFKPSSSNNFKLIGNFSFTDSCDKEFIKITIEGLSGSKADFTICKDTANQTFEYDLSRIKAYIDYRAEYYQAEKNSFVLSLQQLYSCSMDIAVNRIPVTVNIDKAQYKNNQECSWILTARPGEYLQVQFIGRFFIENSPNCTKDYLEIQRDDDGLWLPEARFCGREAPDVYNTSSRRIQIVFRTDDSITADGFELLVNSHCKLRVNVSSNEPTLIVSPTGTGLLLRDFNCEYEFYGQDPNKLIVVRSKLADSHIYYARLQDTCRFGSMTVYKSQDPVEGNEPIRHCDLKFEERAYKYLRLVYNAIRAQTFTLEYAYDSCGGNITTPTIIRPLKHASDNTYADNMECIWYITAPNEHSIAIRFKYFITEENYDVLSIYSGPWMKREKLMAKLSGNYTVKTPILVDSNQAVLKAISDSSNSRKGFEAQIVFVANCNERIALTDGNSPVTLTRNFKFNSSEEYLCNYRITASPGYRLRADIRKLQINGPNSTCQNPQTECNPSTCNYLAVFDGSIAAQVISSKKFCANASTNRTFVSSTEYATLNLNAALPGEYNFEIILTMERTECGLTEYKMGENEKYKFTFPSNGVGPYKPHVHCTWSLISENRLNIHFNYIDLQNKSQVSGKCLDYIRVSHVYSTKDLCGHSQNFTVYNQFSFDKKVEITFHSDEAVEGKGFEFVAQRSDTCNRIYEFLSSKIDYYGSKENETCVDIVKVPENYTLSFFVNSLYFKNFDCDKLHLKIIDVKTNETLLSRCRNSYLVVNVFTQTNIVRIEAARFSVVSMVYIASERGIIPGCGGLLTLTEAQFSSPLYENDRNFSECRWDIKIPTMSRVELRFEEFNMGSITNCNLDNLKIIEILPNGMERLYKTLCGPEIPRELQISGTHFAIISKKSPNFDGTGWTFHYHTIDIANKNDAILINPHA